MLIRIGKDKRSSTFGALAVLDLRFDRVVLILSQIGTIRQSSTDWTNIYSPCGRYSPNSSRNRPQISPMVA
jgi:hypothetical protein